MELTAENAGVKVSKGERTKQKILESAAVLFGHHEFEEVTVDAIVAAAGVSKGTFYIYFDSKDSLIASFLTEYVRNVDMAYKSHLESLPEGTPASQMMLSLIAKIADVLTGIIGNHRMRIVYGLQLSGKVDMEVVKGYNRALYDLFTDVIARGLEQGEFRNTHTVETLTRHFVMAIRGLSYEWCIRYPDFDLKTQALEHFQLLLDGARK